LADCGESLSQLKANAGSIFGSAGRNSRVYSRTNGATGAERCRSDKRNGEQFVRSYSRHYCPHEMARRRQAVGIDPRADQELRSSASWLKQPLRATTLRCEAMTRLLLVSQTLPRFLAEATGRQCPQCGKFRANLNGSYWSRAACRSPAPIISSPAATHLTAVVRGANDR